MWQFNLLLGLILASYCIAAPQQQPQSNGENLDDLISNVFKNNQGRDNNEEDELGGLRTPAPEPGSLADLINNVFRNESKPIKDGDQLNRNPGTILGSKNPNNFGTPDDCKCVPYYQCQNGSINENGMGLIDIRSGFDNDENKQASPSLSGPCENYLEICCKTPDLVNPTISTTQRPLQRNGCGFRHPDGVGFRITGDKDNEAQFGEFPWTVAILREERINQQAPEQVLNVYQCGGALIHRRAVLTAAHCVVGRQPNHLKVRAGEWDTQTKNEVFPHQDRDVSKIIVHEEFNSGSLSNDFAILILSEPVDFAENVDVVCLPRQSDGFDFSRCIASGWGKDVFGQAGHYQVILKKVEVPIVAHDTCQNSLRTTRLGSYFVLNQSFICAGGESGKDTCKGDGGSPLVCPLQNDPSRYAQAGIVSWGIGCGDNGIPGVYANVAQARRWIDGKMAYNNLDTYTYTY